MTFNSIEFLFVSPKVNPVTKRARSIPIFNVVNPYGRVFFFSWLGFMVAFLSWYAFPPLMIITIRADLQMSENEVANSNIVALLATLLVRLVAGPLCDQFGPRYVFAGCLLCGAIPTALVGLVTNPRGLIALRFFVGILGGSFVPCQVWCTGFFDKNIVGTANALAGGWGNAGGGITYFVMPAIFNSLVISQGLSPHVAWRVTYIVPFILITSLSVGMLLLCDDSPTGKWSERRVVLEAESASSLPAPIPFSESKDYNTPEISSEGDSRKSEAGDSKSFDHRSKILVNPKEEAITPPTAAIVSSVLFSAHSWALAAPYACSFGGELAINSIIGSYYFKNFPHLGQTGSGNWAAMFGLVNVVFRPLGGLIGDLLYNKTRSVWSKKLWMTFSGVVMGSFEVAIGLSDPHRKSTMFGLVAGLAFFMDAANGANFSVVPHVHPFANGILSGIVGASGNLGGILFAIIFRYHATAYHTSFWIIGAITICLNLIVAWIRPVPKREATVR